MVKCFMRGTAIERIARMVASHYTITVEIGRISANDWWAASLE